MLYDANKLVRFALWILIFLLTGCLSLLSGAPSRGEAELFLSPLDPLYCVEEAMNAILIDQPMVCIPRLTYLPYICRA